MSETEARRLFGTDRPGRPDADRDDRAAGGRPPRHRRLSRSAAQFAHALRHADPRSIRSPPMREQPDFLTEWGWQSGWYYVALRPGTDPATIHAALPAWERRNIPDQPFGEHHLQCRRRAGLCGWSTSATSISASPRSGAVRPGNDERTILTFTIVAFLILGMACVNFTNLATARASQRAREVALRKVLGANRRQLITQFLAESVLIAAHRHAARPGPGRAAAAGLVQLPRCRPARCTYFGCGRHAAADRRADPAGRRRRRRLSGLLPLAASSRPRCSRPTSRRPKRPAPDWLRNILVVAQFAVSIGLIICTAVVYAQTVHARTADPGYRRDGLHPGRGDQPPPADPARRHPGRARSSGSPASSRSGAPASASPRRTA